ncbi:UAP56-interacting factor-like [Bombina bombina]|uniref:UAP56-interacting factor-like n=1 Tax=Bombina bombina TaxID=8345 RepID=UPI00235ABBC9|nr:UAP56-interacting factor-like [Bombina bombina]
MEDQENQSDSEHQVDNGKIDMSLDDIIKLQKDEIDGQPVLNRTTEQRKARNANFQVNRYLKGIPKNYQGPNRSKLGFQQQGYSGGNLRNSKTGPVTRRAASLNGVSPLNRNNTEMKGTQKAVGNYTSRGTPKIRRGPQQQRRFRATSIPVQVLTRSTVNEQNRRPQFNQAQRQQRPYIANQNRRLTQQKANSIKRMSNLKKWKTEDEFGSTLTISVNNPKARQNTISPKPNIKHPGLRFRKKAQPVHPLPKGVPLRFNFKAMANHTHVTLNERFSSLKIRGQFTTPRRGARTVTLA